jgi:hypothetical protein
LSSEPRRIVDNGAVINARRPSPIGVANACGTDRAATGVAALDDPRDVPPDRGGETDETDGDVVALTATGESCAGGVTMTIRIPTAMRPIDPVAIANPRVERCTSVCRIASRSAAATSDG